jgi:hypothetical protein
MGRRVHVESRAIDAAFTSAHDVASDFVRSFGWRPPPAWTEIDREGAIEVLSSALMNDLVDDAPRMPFREAEARARELVADCEQGSVFLTNGVLEELRRGFRAPKITSAKADTGVIAVSPRTVQLVWIEDGGPSRT